MKVLFLNPQIGSDHAILQGLRRRGVAVLQPRTPVEALQMLALHGKSVDLALIHREIPEGGTGGLDLVFKLKGDPVQVDLPFVLTTQSWSDAECAAHQKTPLGANAYLKYPFTESQLVQVIEAVTGQSLAIQPLSAETKSGITMAEAPSVVIENRGQPINLSASGAPSNGNGEGTHLMSADEHAEASLSAEIPTAHLDSTFVLPSGVGDPPTAVPDTRSAVKTPVPPRASKPGAPRVAEEVSLIMDPGTMEVQLSAGPGMGDVALEAPPREDFAPAADDGLGAIVLETPPISESIPPAGPETDEPVHLAFDLPETIVAAAETPSALADELPQVQAESEPSIQFDAAPEEPRLEFSPPPIPTAAADEGEQSEPSFQRPMKRAVEGSDSDDHRLAQDLPYLFSKAHPSSDEAAVALAQPLGDAVVPGGAAQAPDVETLKRYLLLREQDVAALSAQLKAARQQAKQFEESLRTEKGRTLELTHVAEEQRRRIQDFEREKGIAVESAQSEVSELKFQLKARAERARALELQIREATEETERLKERVRTDIRRIRVREKELENRLEIMKKDAEALIASRENRIIELKRKLDTLEFNLDLLQDKYSREKQASARLRERLQRASQAVRAAGGMLDPSVAAEDEGLSEPQGTATDDRAAS